MESVVKLLKNKYAPFFFAVPLFFISYRYSGIVVDAILYLIQYAHYIDPSRFVGDPSFEFGNQDSLGFFTPVLGLFIKPLGANLGMMVYTVTMQFLWIIAAVFMLKSLMRLTCNRLWTLPITILFVFCFSNGMPIEVVRFFHFVECYACSRSLSMVAGIAALAALFSNRRWLSLAFILFGTVVHPLTAGWCLPLWFFYFFPKTRWPIAIFSLLFPLTFLLHTGPLDVFPEDWLRKPLVFRPTYVIIGRYVALLSFFGLVVKKFSKNEKVLRISSALVLVLAIALYWDCWGGYGKHVLLYQVQPWRVFWLGAIIAVPLFLCFLKDALLYVYGHKKVTEPHFVLFLIGMNLLAPQSFILISLSPLALLRKKFVSKPIQEKYFIAVFALFVVLGLVIQQYNAWCIQGFKTFLGYDFRALSYMRDGALFAQFCFSVGFAVHYLRRRNFIIPGILALYCVFPWFQMIPLLAIALIAFPKANKKKYWGMAVLVLLVVVADGILNSDGRLHKLINGYPSITLQLLLLLVLTALAVWARKFSRIPMVALILVCAVVGVATYDDRRPSMREAEKAIDDFVEEAVFPQVENWGHVLFYVNDVYAFESQLRFMTGSYLSVSMGVGTIFNEKYYREYRRRCWLLNFGRYPTTKEELRSDEMNVSTLSNADTLMNRVEFLCREKEITNFISNIPAASLEMQDSTTLKNGTKVYLYACP